MNYLKDVISLKNRYFAMRHGHSESNALDIFVTDPDNGVDGYGLTELGRKQAEKSAKKNSQSNILDKETIIYTSDFKRARETAEIARIILKAAPVNLEKKLRERYFGIFEMDSLSNYTKVWEEDKANPNSKKYEVESANELLKRMTSIIPDLENKHSGKKILLVSHADPLQLLNVGFLKVSASEHCKLKFFENAEIRELKLKK